MNYSNAKLATTLYNYGKWPNLSSRLHAWAYFNDWAAGKVSSWIPSHLKIGKNSFSNKLRCVHAIKFN